MTISIPIIFISAVLFLVAGGIAFHRLMSRLDAIGRQTDELAGRVKAMSEDLCDARTSLQKVGTIPSPARNLPELRPDNSLVYASFESVFLPQGDREPHHKPDWIDDALLWIQRSDRFPHLNPDQLETAKRLLMVANQMGRYAIENREVIAAWALDWATSGVPPVRSLVVTLLTAPTDQKLQNLDSKVVELLGEGRRERWADLRGTYESIRRVATSDVPENRTFLLELQRQIDDHKSYFRERMKDEAGKIREPGWIQRKFSRAKAKQAMETQRTAEFDAYIGDFLVYRRLLGLELLVTQVLNDPDIMHGTLRSLSEEMDRMRMLEEGIEAAWLNGHEERKALPEPELLSEIRALTTDTKDRLSALSSSQALAKPPWAGSSSLYGPLASQDLAPDIA